MNIDLMDSSESKHEASDDNSNRSVASSVDIVPTDRNTVMLFGNIEVYEQDAIQFSQKHSDKPKKTLMDKNFYIAAAWSPQIYFTSRGAENFHVYLWIAKDLCWTQNYREAGILFGSAAMAWCGVLFFHALVAKAYEDAYMLLPMTLWLSGNFFWMLDELETGDDTVGGYDGSVMFETALALIVFYHVALRPMGYLQPDKEQIRTYEKLGLKSRFPYFKTWRQYEHIHTLFWIGKDFSWNMATRGYLDFQVVWVIFVIPTFVVAIDFLYVTWKTKSMMIDFAHYTAQLIWVSANITWAGGEVFLSAYDNPYYIFHISHNAQLTARWYSSWLLFFAYLPILMLLAVWLPLTVLGRLEAADTEYNKSFVERKSRSFAEHKSKSFSEQNVRATQDFTRSTVAHISPFHRDSDRPSSATDVENAAITAANTAANATSGASSVDSESRKI